MKRISSFTLALTMIFMLLSTTVQAAVPQPLMLANAAGNDNPLIASIMFDNQLQNDADPENPLKATGAYSYVDGIMPGTKALHLESGSGNYVGTTKSLPFGEDSFTVSFWYKGDTNQNSVILSNKDFSNGSNAGWAIYTSARSVKMNLGFPNASVKNISFGRNTFDASDWRYVTFVVDRDKLLASLYIDGYKMDDTPIRRGALDTSNPLNIGCDGLGNRCGNSFDIADLKIWKGAISSDVIQANYNSYGGNNVDLQALTTKLAEAHAIIAGSLGNGFSETDFDSLKKVANMANTVATTQKVKFYTQETINYYERELDNAIFIYQKSNKALTPADLNMTVNSDPEISSNPAAIERVESDMRKAMSVFPQADVMVMPGDITGGNNANEYVWMGHMRDVYNKLKNEGLFDTTKLYMVKGNHDMNGSENLIPVGTAGAWNESTNSYDNDFYNSAYRVKINGYNLIGFDANINSESTVGKAKNYLNQIKSEPDYDPTKPIFVMSHYPISGTVWGSAWSSAASNNFGQFLTGNDFSQVFYMSGHTQYDPTDERSLYQGAATFLDSGATSYSSYIDNGPYGGYIEGAYINYKTTPRILNFLEVYGPKLIIKQYNVSTNEFVGTPRVVNVGEGKDAFTYNKNKIKELIAPQFDEGIKVDSLTSNEVTFTIKQATDNVRGLEYNVQLINRQTGEVDKSFNSLSLPLDKPYDEYRQYKITGLMPKTSYLLRIFAADDMYNRSYQDVDITTPGAKLTSITAPAAVSANNGTAKTAAALGLPANVTIVTDGGIINASVNWDLSSVSYDPAIKTVQTFPVPGTVTLPLGVENPNNVSLTTSIDVTVQAAGVAAGRLTLDKSQYLQGEAISMSYSGAAAHGKDWVGIYKAGAVPPGAGVSITWGYLKGGSGKVSLNNGLAPGMYDVLYMLNDGYEIVARKTFEVVQHVTLKSITAPAAIQGVANGTVKTAEALGLPSTVELVTDKGNKNVAVSWDVAAANYDHSLTIEQTFTVNGTVTLPAGVLNPDNVALTTSISVTVLPALTMPQSTLTGLQQAAAGQSFEITMGLTGVTQSVYQSVYAQDLTLHFDPAFIQFDSVASLNDGFKVIDQKETAPGQIRIMAASLAANVPAQGDLLAFKFTAKTATQAAHTTTISVDHVVIAGGQGNELQVNGASHEIQIMNSVDKSLLNALIANAQTMYNAAVEGNGDGLYAIGSKAQLQSAIEAASAIANDPNADQQQVDIAKTTLEAAVQAFNAKKITADINGGGVTIGDLAIVAAVYGKESDQAGWNARADVNHDGRVDLIDLVIVAKAILK
ncbi:LamG-like jellyroll fold domain-containing protein [Paenibacillus sp. MBLB4367]|uniref:LamG-like jellyroll fold domain-containing protein n=1 Tax=Paenibacillus sp. MBLB4367 TaxID=3384767 RepID=UPI0039082FA7